MFHSVRSSILILTGVLLINHSSLATVLMPQDRSKIEQKLAVLPITRKTLWSLLYPSNNKQVFDQSFQEEIEGILKSSLLEGDTQVALLTPEIRSELNLDRGVAAFHKQGAMQFKIIPSRAGSFQENKQNDLIRMLTHPRYFAHAHNVFVADEQVSWDLNTLSLLIHELSHAAFDQWVIKNPDKLEGVLRGLLPQAAVLKLLKTGKGTLEIDGDLYDLLSERYAFELEYRLNRQITKVMPEWPFYFSFTENPSDQFPELIDDYVRRHYDIDHPLLKGLPVRPLDRLLE